MKKYKFTYSQGSTINKKLIVEAKNISEAIHKFMYEVPNGDYEKVEVLEDEAL